MLVLCERSAFVKLNFMCTKFKYPSKIILTIVEAVPRDVVLPYFFFF